MAMASTIAVASLSGSLLAQVGLGDDAKGLGSEPHAVGEKVHRSRRCARQYPRGVSASAASTAPLALLLSGSRTADRSARKTAS